MTLFDNAVTSIQLALEDFSANNDRRLLSAVRNLHSGILLLFKSRLADLSPQGSQEVLIKRNISPVRSSTGQIVLIGEGKTTVNTFQIRSRFKSLKIHADWERFEKISAVRNEIEHYSTSINADLIREMILNALVIVRDFMSEELSKDPKDELGEEAWATLLSVGEVFEKELAECRRQLGLIDWDSETLAEAISQISCFSCGSALVFPIGQSRTAGVQCRSCDDIEKCEACAERALSGYLGPRNHYAMREGGEEVLIICPFCFQEAYVVDEEQCAICGEGCEHTCSFCSNPIPVSELSDGKNCGYCDHMLNKDD